MKVKSSFNFNIFPNLKEKYEKYYKLKMNAVYWSMKDGLFARKKMDEADKLLKDYAYNIFARAIFEEFSGIKPVLFKEDEEEKIYRWDEVFNSNFEELDINKRKCLVGLLNRTFVYSLPNDYYVD